MPEVHAYGDWQKAAISVSWRVGGIAMVGTAVHPALSRKAARRNDAYGKHDACFPAFPHFWEMPSGFPYSHGLHD